MTPHNESQLWALFMAGCGSFSVKFGFEMLKKSRLIEDTPRSNIATSPQGLVRFSGMTVPSSTVWYTSAGQKTVYRKYVVREKTKNGWQEVSKHIDTANFYIKDQSGTAEIDPQNFEVVTASDRIISYSQYLELCGPQLQMVSGDSVLAKVDNFIHGQREVIESWVCAHEPIFAIGSFRSFTVEKKLNGEKVFGQLHSISEKTTVISTKDEKSLAFSDKMKAILFIFMGGVLAFIGIAQFFGLFNKR